VGFNSAFKGLKIHEIYIHIQQMCSNGGKIEESEDVRMSTLENVESLVSDTEGY